jgi:hypothetical protein
MNATFTSIICSWAVYSRSGYPAVIAPCVYLISACPPRQLLIKLRWKRMRSGDRPGLQNRRAAGFLSPVGSTPTRFRHLDCQFDGCPDVFQCAERCKFVLAM